MKSTVRFPPEASRCWQGGRVRENLRFFMCYPDFGSLMAEASALTANLSGPRGGRTEA